MAQNVAPLTIRSIFSDGLAAEKAPPLMPGCVLLAVNADELLGLAAPDALQVLREATQQRRSRAKPLVLRFAPPPGATHEIATDSKLAKVAQDADLNRRKRDEWLKGACSRSFLALFSDFRLTFARFCPGAKKEKEDAELE